MEKSKTQFKGVVLLLITALIWGSSFVAQSVGTGIVGAFTFSGIRTLLGAFALLPVIIITDRAKKKKMDPQQWKQKRALDRKTIVIGSLIGLVFCAASNFQQHAFYYSTPGKIAFITALYMFLVPVLGLFLRKKVPLLTWICVIAGFGGLYFLCLDPENLGAVNKGDLLALVCSFFFAIHILVIEKFAPSVDALKLSFAQFLVSGVISCILMFIFENPDINAIREAAVPIMYSGIMSCTVAYTFQIIGQKYTESTVASLLMCMESVFAVIVSAIVLHQVMTGREILGCSIMFAAIILSQLSEGLSIRHANRLALRRKA